MTFHFSTSGPVQQVKEYLVSTAEQYVDDGVHHVEALLQKLVDAIANEHGVSVSASGHSSASGASLSVQVTPGRPPESDTPPAATIGAGGPS